LGAVVTAGGVWIVLVAAWLVVRWLVRDWRVPAAERAERERRRRAFDAAAAPPLVRTRPDRWHDRDLMLPPPVWLLPVGLLQGDRTAAVLVLVGAVLFGGAVLGMLVLGAFNPSRRRGYIADPFRPDCRSLRDWAVEADASDERSRARRRTRLWRRIRKRRTVAAK
jgi:hypothetical protein